MDDAAARSQFLFGTADAPDDLDEAYPSPDDLAGLSGLPGGWTVVRRTVAEQILADDPPETWVAAQRLLASGMDREDAIDELARGWYYGLAAALGDPASGQDLPSTAGLIGDVADVLEKLPLPAEEDVEDALIEAIADDQGIAAEELADGVAETFGGDPESATAAVVRHVVRELMDDDDIGVLPGPRLVHRPSLAASVVLTHRLTADEIAGGVLGRVSTDLCLFADEAPFSGDDELEIVDAGDGTVGWRGPDGWLSAFDAGDLIAVRVDGDHMLFVERVTDVGDPSSVVPTLVAAFEQLADEYESAVPMAALVTQAQIDAPGLFAEPRPPITELCATAGVELRGDFVGTSPEHWTAMARQLRHSRLHEAGAEDDDAAHAALDVLDDLEDPESSPSTVRAALRAMADDPIVAELVVDELAPPEGAGPLPVADAGATIERLLAGPRRPREVAVASWISAVAAERADDVLAAEAHLVEGYAADATFPLLIDHRAWYASDRGDAATAHRLWNSLDSPPPDALEILGRVLGRTGPKLGRNDPCWCGSGRKYKVCHLRRTDPEPLATRVPWLWYKAKSYLLHRGGSVRMDVVSNIVALAGGDPETMFGPVVHDPFAIDAALVEGGWFPRFLDARGQLLPDDERQLATTWLAVRRSVHEVESVDADATVLRDVRSGDRVTIRAGSLPHKVSVGELWCLRAVPDGTDHQVVGGVFEVAPGSDDDVLAVCDRGDPIDLCAYISVHRG